MTVRGSKGATFRKSIHREGLQFRDVISHKIARKEFANPQHFEAVVAICDHIDIWQHPVEDRNIVWRKGANPAIASLAELRPDALKPFHRLTHGGAHIICKPIVCLILVIGVAIRIGNSFRADLYRCSSFLSSLPSSITQPV